MLKLRNKNIGIALAALAIALMLLTAPALAGKQSARKSKSPQNVKKQRSASTRTQKTANTSKPRTTSSSSTKPRTRATTSASSVRSSTTRTIKKSASRSGAAPVTKTPTRSTNISSGAATSGTSRAKTISTRPSVGTKNSTSTRNTNSAKTSRIAGPIKASKTSAKAKKQQNAKSAKTVTSNKTSRIASRIDTKSSGNAATKKQSNSGAGKRLSKTKTSRIAKVIGKNESPVGTASKSVTRIEPKTVTRQTEQDKSSKVLSGSGTRDKSSVMNIKSSRKRNSLTLKTVNTRASDSRTTKAAPARRKATGNTASSSRTADKTVNKMAVLSSTDKSLRSSGHRTSGARRHGRSSRIIYEERRHTAGSINHHLHVYRDHHNRLCRRIVWPRYYYPVYYRWGPFWTFRYIYPYYHRKYVFVSLTGYWPIGYRYVRYYWYPYHPYDWYGYYPVARQIQGDTYNYYTYNYYTDGSASTQYTQGLSTVDENTFADVREKLAAQAQEPDAQTIADVYFDDAVKAFEDADYDTAADKFAGAMKFAPDDIVLPFAYVQALFADKMYLQAADALRQALTSVPTEQEGIFYPRGLYSEEDTLFEQIGLLAERVELCGFDPDLQLLLGYQLLGVGESEQAVEYLQQAALNPTNRNAATILLELLEKIETEEDENIEQ